MSRSSQSMNSRCRREIDRCCDRFEADWCDGRRSPVETYLASADATVKDDCLKSLLELEFKLRRAAGETPRPDEYTTRFEGRQEIVPTVFDIDQSDTSGGLDSSLRPEETLAETPDGRKRFGGIPDEFGRYRIERQIGRGAMGCVFLAEDTVLGHAVALKIPSLTGHGDDQLLERFRREGQAAAVLRHPNICPTFDFGDVDGTYYMAMAWIDGEPMSQIIAESGGDSGHPNDVTSPDEEQIVCWVRKLALAFEEAHRSGIVHRDIKPANVMIDTQGEPIVMDFGLAMSTQPSTDVRLTQTGTQLGSPYYMSPEQVDGDMRMIGPKSDIYSLGVLFYELLTGRVPFDGSVAAVFVQIITREPVPPSEVRPGISERLESLCLRMMARRPEDRPASMAEVATSLQPIQAAGAGREINGSSEPARPQTATPQSGQDFEVHRSETPGFGEEAELRNLMADIGTALREHRTDGVLARIERVLYLQPGNPAMLRLRGSILKNRINEPAVARRDRLWMSRLAAIAIAIVIGGGVWAMLLYVLIPVWQGSAVSGRVTLDGQPLADAAITFIDTEAGIQASGLINDDGTYVLTTMQGGLNPGTYVVTFAPTKPEPDAVIEEFQRQFLAGQGTDGALERNQVLNTDDPNPIASSQESANQLPPGTIPMKYRTTDSSGLAVQVVDGRNKFSFELKSKSSWPRD